MKTLYLIRGLPGSGKSTYARSLRLSNHYEADMWFDRELDGEFDPSKLKLAHEWCQSMAKKAMHEGADDVVVSNTFTQQWEMVPYKEAAKAAGYQVKVVRATGTWTSIHGVPASTIDAMRDRFEDDPQEELLTA